MPDEDIFTVDDEDNSNTDDDAKRNSEFARMRKELKDLKAIAKEAEELRTFKAEREQADKTTGVSTIVQELGLPPEWGKFYPGDEVTPDAIKQWAIAEKFLQVDQESESAPPPPAPTTGFTPTVIEGTQPVGTKTYSVEEFMELQKVDPRKAEAVYKAGRLKKEEPEWSYSSRFYGRDT
jgi:hypothetical protein